jgi:hypothetical protein
LKVVALVTDLMDRSKISAALDDVTFGSSAGDCEGAGLVVVDLGAHAGEVAKVRSVAAEARIVVFGRHDNPEALAAARADGADDALPRSRFFRDPRAAVAGS